MPGVSSFLITGERLLVRARCTLVKGKYMHTYIKSTSSCLFNRAVSGPDVIPSGTQASYMGERPLVRVRCIPVKGKCSGNTRLVVLTIDDIIGAH